MWMILPKGKKTYDNTTQLFILYSNVNKVVIVFLILIGQVLDEKMNQIKFKNIFKLIINV